MVRVQNSQTEVMDAYAAAFRKTPVLLRYPAGDSDSSYAPNDRRNFGYHDDDSFAWATLDTGRKNEDWFYLARLRNAGPAAMERWRTAPIGGGYGLNSGLFCGRQKGARRGKFCALR